MKILHVETGRRMYGGPLQVEYLMSGLGARGLTNLLLCGDDCAVADSASADRVWSVAYRGELDARLVFHIARLARAEHVDIIHAHGRRGADLWAGVAARWAGVPAIVTRRVDNTESRVWAPIKYSAYRRIVAISGAVADVLDAAGAPADRVVRIADAVDTSVYRPASESAWFRQEFDVADNAVVLGMAAQFIARKGHRDLIAALARVVARGLNVALLLFGRGPLQEPVYRAVQAAGLAGYVQFAGFRDDLARVLPNLDVLVHPAHREGMGVAVLQAQACGVPVIAAAAGGVLEVIADGDTGRLYPAGDVAALADSIEVAVGDADWRRAASQRARERVCARFCVARMANSYTNLYRQALDDELR